MSNPLEEQNKQFKHMNILTYIIIYLLIGVVVVLVTGTTDVLVTIFAWPLLLLQFILMFVILLFAALANAGVIG